MISYQKIEGFLYGEIAVRQLVACHCGELTMLLCPEQGTTLAVSRDCAEAIAKHMLTDDLAFLLIQRGMAQHPQSRQVSLHSEQVCPEFFLIDLTKACNLACTYCFREPCKEQKRIASETLERICYRLISYAQRHPDRKLGIQPWGGEPLLELPSIIQLRQRFQEAGLHPEIVIETNGTLITPDVARKLLENDVQIGISIDGIASVHDSQRPTQAAAPSLALVEQGIQNLRDAGYQGFGTITVVTRKTLECLPQILDYFVNTLHLDSVKFNLMRKNDRSRDLAIDLKDIGRYVEQLLECMRKMYIQKDFIVEQNISQRIANLLFRPNNNICNAHGCHGGYQMLSIDASGTVYPCELSDFPDYALGSIEQGELDDMVGHAIGKKQEYFQPRDTSFCRDCPWWYYCRGGCKSAAKYDTGSPYGIDQTECQLNRELYPRLVEILLTEPDFGQYLLNGGM